MDNMPIAAHGGDIFAAARRLGISSRRLVDFSASINPLGLSPKAYRRLKREIQTVCHYPDRRQEELRMLVSSRHKIDPECIVFGNGATQLLYLVTRCLLPRKAMLMVPGFTEYRAALGCVQTNINEFRLRTEIGFNLETSAFLASLQKSKPDCILLANPNNPTGTVIPHDEILRIANFCRRVRTNFVVDESFVDFTQEASLAGLTARNPFLIVVQSLTKFFALPGLRIGYLVAQRSVAKTLAQAVEPWSVNTLALAAAAESIKDGAYRKRTLALIAKERAYLLTGLRKLGWLEPYSSHVNFVLVRSKRRRLSGDVLRRELERMHFLIRDSSGFGGLGPEFFRVAVRTHKENRRLLDALQVLGEQTVSLGAS